MLPLNVGATVPDNVPEMAKFPELSAENTDEPELSRPTKMMVDAVLFLILTVCEATQEEARNVGACIVAYELKFPELSTEQIFVPAALSIRNGVILAPLFWMCTHADMLMGCSCEYPTQLLSVLRQHPKKHTSCATRSVHLLLKHPQNTYY